MDFKPVVTISWELLFQIINTVILFLVLKKLLFKPVLNIIEKRENMIQDDLATGAKAKNEGIALKKEYEEKVSLAKEEGKEIEIDIELKIGKVKKNQFIGNRKVTISLNDLPVLKVEEVNASQIRMFEDMTLQYSIEKKDNYAPPFVITALCVDNRA